MTPLFWTHSDVSSEFQSQDGQPYSHLAEKYLVYGGRCNGDVAICPIFSSLSNIYIKLAESIISLKTLFFVYRGFHKLDEIDDIDNSSSERSQT